MVLPLVMAATGCSAGAAPQSKQRLSRARPPGRMLRLAAQVPLLSRRSARMERGRGPLASYVLT